MPPGPAEWALIGSSALHALLYASFVWLAARAGSVFASQASYFTTASGIIWAMLLLGERFSPWVWAAAAIMLCGLAGRGGAWCRGRHHRKTGVLGFMAGHSKWANIQRRKGKQDKLRFKDVFQSWPRNHSRSQNQPAQPGHEPTPTYGGQGQQGPINAPRT